VPAKFGGGNSSVGVWRSYACLEFPSRRVYCDSVVNRSETEGLGVSYSESKNVKC